MQIQAAKTLPNGVIGNCWKITKIRVDLEQLVSSFVVSLFLDSSQATSLGITKRYDFKITSDQVLTGTLAGAYTAILNKAKSEVPNLIGGGTHIFDEDLASGTIVQ